jgi:hypothetical protein
VSRGIFRKGFGLDAEARKLQGSLLPTPKKGTSMWGFSNYICTFRHGALIKFQILSLNCGKACVVGARLVVSSLRHFANHDLAAICLRELKLMPKLSRKEKYN